MNDRRSPPALVFTSLAASLALAGCGHYQDAPISSISGATTTIQSDSTGVVHFDGNFDLLIDGTGRGSTEARLYSLDVGTTQGLPFLDDVRVVRQSPSFPLALGADEQRSVKVGFTATSSMPPADELGWMCKHAIAGLILHASIYDTASDVNESVRGNRINPDAPVKLSAVRTTPEANRFDPGWSRTFGAMGEAVLSGAAMDAAGDAVVAGSFQLDLNFGDAFHNNPIAGTDAFVVKLNSQGKALWSHAFGGNGWQTADAVAIGDDGTTFVLGHFTGPVGLGDGTSLPSIGDTGDEHPPSMFLLAFYPTGQLAWHRTLLEFWQDPSMHCPTSEAFLASDGAGGVFVGGTFLETLDLGDTQLAAQSGGPGACPADVFAVRYGPKGDRLWSKSYGDTVVQRVTSIAADPQGNLLLAGLFDGQLDLGQGPLSTPSPIDPAQSALFVAKLDPQGQTIFGRTLGATARDLPGVLAADSKGNVLVAGGFLGALDAGTGPIVSSADIDAFVVKLDPTGKALWGKAFPDDGITFVTAVATAVDDRILLTGSTSSSVDFGGIPVQGGPPGKMLYLAELDAGGGYLKSRGFACDTGRAVIAAHGASALLGAAVGGVIDTGDGVMHAQDQPLLLTHLGL